MMAALTGDSYDSLGLSYLWAGRSDRAIQQLQQALRLKPDFEIALIDLADVHFQSGQCRKVVELSRQSVAIAPSDRESARRIRTVPANPEMCGP
jgi:Tfp pilus assembly protein PilF